MHQCHTSLLPVNESSFGEWDPVPKKATNTHFSFILYIFHLFYYSSLCQVPELKLELQRRGLDTVGTRKELAARLVEHETRPRDEPPPQPPELPKAVEVDSDDDAQGLFEREREGK